VLVVFGLLVVMVAFAGWASIVFGTAKYDTNVKAGNFGAMLGERLPSGIPIGVVYFLGFGVGGLLLSIGSSMAKAGARGANLFGHLIVTIGIIAVAIFVLFRVLGGAPLSTLTPSFSGARAIAFSVGGRFELAVCGVRGLCGGGRGG
jgi:hypothetical protein